MLSRSMFNKLTTTAGEVPNVLVRICSKTTFFDLSDNKFDFPSEVGGGRSYLRHVCEHVRNMQVVEVDLRNQSDLIDVDGLQYYKNLARLNLSGCSAVQGDERMKTTVSILNNVSGIVHKTNINCCLLLLLVVHFTGVNVG